MRHWLALGVMAATLPLIGASPRPTDPLMSADIDRLIDKKAAAAGVAVAPPSSDAEFLRRVSLDLAGVIPSADEVLSFNGDRAAAVDAILASEAHATYWAELWTETFVGKPLGDVYTGIEFFSAYVLQAVRENRPFDQMAREVVAAEGLMSENGATYYTFRWQNPAELAGATGRIFMGVQIRCAQCHDHPFDAWKQEDFWSFAAFFARTRLEYAGDAQGLEPNYEISDRYYGEVDLPESQHPIVRPPKFPGGVQPSIKANGRRTALADWLASPENPYFARATVNRVWARLFGRGLVNPVEDLSPRHAPSHPELLERLAEDFARSGYDVRRLLRLIVNTRAYQRSSKGPAADPALFAVASVRPMSLRQIFESVARAAEFDFTIPEDTRTPDEIRQGYQYEYDAAGSPPERILVRLNGSLVRDAIAVGRTIPDALALPDPGERLERLFVAALSRRPARAESEYFMRHLRSSDDPDAALSDVLWALVNSAEFAQVR